MNPRTELFQRMADALADVKRCENLRNASLKTAEKLSKEAARWLETSQRWNPERDQQESCGDPLWDLESYHFESECGPLAMCPLWHNIKVEYVDLLRIAYHHHVNNHMDDRCDKCGHDLRHIVHTGFKIGGCNIAMQSS